MSNSNKHIAIIGGGLTGLSLGFFLSKQGIPFTIIEKSNRVGGVIQTNSEHEFTYECGPNTGVLGTIEIENLLQELSNDCTIEIANETAKKRLILKNGEWHALPSGLISAICTPLFTFRDKIKILGEPFRKKGNNPNETIHQMVDRRLGKSFHNYAVAPFINGVYAGNTDKLITRFALPKLFNLEQEYGSFIKGTFAKSKLNKKQGTPTPSKKVFSCIGGLSSIISALEKRLSPNIQLNCNTISITKNESTYTLHWIQDSIEKSENFSHIITTCNPFEINNIIPNISKEQKQILNSSTYAPVVQASIGFKEWNGISIKAFGGLISPIENRNILGVLFTSSMFRNKSPQNGALLSIFMGGMLRTDIISLSDSNILEILKTEVSDLLKIPIWNPEIIKIHRHTHAIAQYNIEMEAILKTIQEIENANPNIYIAGSIKDGIGMADRVKQAYSISQKVI